MYTLILYIFNHNTDFRGSPKVLQTLIQYKIHLWQYICGFIKYVPIMQVITITMIHFFLL